MEKSLLHISVQDKKDSQGQPQLPAIGQIGRYDTHLLPLISLPQRHRQADGRQQGGLLHYCMPEAQSPIHDPGLTVAMDKYELARSIAAANQVASLPQNTLPATYPSLPVTPTTISKQQHMQTWQETALYRQPAQGEFYLSAPPPISPDTAQGSSQIPLLAFMKSLLTVKLPECLKKFFFTE